MVVKNSYLGLKLETELLRKLESISSQMEIKKSELLRYLIFNGLNILEGEKVKSGSYKKLKVTYSLV